MLQLGASKYEIRLTYEVKTTSCSDDFEEMHRSERSVFTYKGLFTLHHLHLFILIPVSFY